MGINRAIGRLAAFFLVAYALLGVRQLWLQVAAAPRISANAHDPRRALLGSFRGAIVARDGTVLARSTPRGRAYPLGAAAAHAVGYESARYGESGIEAAFDRELSGRAVPSNPLAQLRSLFGGTYRAGIPGATVITTLDPVVQRTLYEGLRAHARAAGVAIDPRSGEVLALASVPSFDPESLDSEFASISKSAQSPLVNRATDGLYPPGSTFKIFTAASALEAGAVQPDSTFEDPGSLQIGSFTVHDNEGEATGMQDLTGAFALSSNVDFAQIALRLGIEPWFAYAERWKLGSPLQFTLPAQADRLPSRAEVTPSILAQLGFGQADLLVTPLRMALVASTIAAGGAEPRPFLVRAVRESGRPEREVAGPATIATPVSPETADVVRNLMVAVVRRGTGTAAALPNATVAGKTGTATNPAGKSHAWFVAFAPAEAPRVAVAIVVENSGYGGTFAAPIARRVLSVALARIGS